MDSDSSLFVRSPSVDLGNRTHAKLLRSLESFAERFSVDIGHYKERPFIYHSIVNDLWYRRMIEAGDEVDLAQEALNGNDIRVVRPENF